MITFSLDEQDMRSASALAARWDRKRWMLVGGALLVCLAAGICLLVFARAFGTLHTVAVFLGVMWFAAAAGLVATIGAMRYLWIPQFVRRQYHRDPGVRREKTLSWDDRGITAESENGRMLMPWGDFVKWREDDSTILVYRSARLGVVIPKRAFENREQLWELQALLGTKMKREL